jgi:predicted branched-subunit amino acid permease
VITPRDAFVHGVRDLLPAAPGVFAWGLVTGVAMVKSGLGVPEAIVLSLLAYAGSAQLAALPLIATFAPIWLIFVTAVIVNLRFVVYSVMARSHFAGLSMRRRLWLGYLVGDIMFARFSALLEREPNYPHRIAYYFGGASCNWMWWQVSSILGIVAATAIPVSWGLELAGTLTLIALLVPLCRQWPVMAGATVAAATSVLAHDLPLRLGLPLGIVFGVATAFVADRRRGEP